MGKTFREHIPHKLVQYKIYIYLNYFLCIIYIKKNTVLKYNAK